MTILPFRLTWLSTPAAFMARVDHLEPRRFSDEYGQVAPVVGRLSEEAGHAELLLGHVQQRRVVIGPVLAFLEGCHVQVQAGEEGELAPQPRVTAVVNPAA